MLLIRVWLKFLITFIYFIKTLKIVFLLKIRKLFYYALYWYGILNKAVTVQLDSTWIKKYKRGENYLSLFAKKNRYTNYSLQ